MNERQELNMQVMRAKLEAVESDIRYHLEQEVSGLDKQIAGYQTDSRFAAAGLNLKIQTLEAQNVKVTVM